MRINKNIQYKLGKRLTMLAISGATLFGACSKDDNNEDIVPKQDIEVVFTETNVNPASADSVRLLLKRPDVDKVYLVPNEYMGWSSNLIHMVRDQILEPAINVNPDRVKGRGNFSFHSGNCSTTDSLWFVSKGWTVNQKQH